MLLVRTLRQYSGYGRCHPWEQTSGYLRAIWVTNFTSQPVHFDTSALALDIVDCGRRTGRAMHSTVHAKRRTRRSRHGLTGTGIDREQPMEATRLLALALRCSS